MSRRDPEIALKQILSHAREAVDICQGRTRSDLDSDRLLNLALTRLIEIVGEAANRVPDSGKISRFPLATNDRRTHRLIHGYDSVDFDILWSIVNHDLPSVIARLEGILDQKASDP
jgi:uncharacterized protein with HEPN domain